MNIFYCYGCRSIIHKDEIKYSKDNIPYHMVKIYINARIQDCRCGFIIEKIQNINMKDNFNKLDKMK